MNRGSEGIGTPIFRGSFLQEKGRKLIAIEANSGNEYDKMEQVKSDVAALGIASFLDDGSNEKVALAREVYGAQVARMNDVGKLKRMASDEKAS